MNTLRFYWSHPSQKWPSFSFASVFCVIFHKKENHRVERRHRASKPVVWTGLTDWWAHGSHLTSVYLDRFCFKSLVWKLDEVSLSSRSASWELGFVIGETVLSGLHHLEGTSGSQSNSLAFEDMNQHSFRPAVPAIGGMCHEGSQSVRKLCSVTFIIVSLVPAKPHLSSTCPMSQMNGSMTGGVPYSYERLETPFLLYHSYGL